MAVLFTGFARGDLHRLRRCVGRLGGTVVRDLPEPDALGANVAHPAAEVRVVTPVVTRCATLGQAARPEGGARTAASRTIKYFDALLAGSWVVSPDWVLESYAAERWLPEHGFELLGDSAGSGGPACSRRHGPPLFSGLRLHFCSAAARAGRKGAGRASLARSRLALDEAGGPEPGDLERLARRGGAEVLSAISPLPDSEAYPPHLGAAALAAAAASSGTSRWRRPIAVAVGAVGGEGGSAGGANVDAEAERAGWTVLPSGWLLDCISLGEIIEPPTGDTPAPAGIAATRRCRSS